MHGKTPFVWKALSPEGQLTPSRRGVSPPTAAWLLSLLCWIFPACNEEKPYTPFQVATSLPGPSAAPSPGSNPHVEPDAAKAARVATSPPPGSKSWQAFGRTITAPPDTIIALGLELATGPPDSVAVWFLSEESRKPAADAGLWLVDMSGRPTKKLLVIDEKLPKGSDCRFRAGLLQSGPKSITSRLRSECTSRILPGTPVESIVVLAVDRADPVLLDFLVEEAPPGETLTLKVDSSDRDGDGSDDVELGVSLLAPGGQEETLPFRWLSRTAGASRDTDSPKSEFKKIVSQIHTASIRKKERGDVPKRADALRRLLASTCSKAETARIARAGQRGLDCGDLRASLVSLSESVVQAHLGEKEYELGLGEAERADWFLEKRSDAEKQRLKDLLTKIPSKEATRLATFKVAPLVSTGPSLSPLLFDQTGQLWLQTKEKRTKRLTMAGDPPLVQEATEDQPGQRIEAPSWSLVPLDQSTTVLSAVLPSCDRSEVQLVFSDPTGTPRAPIPVPVLAPRPGACKNLSAFPLEIVPLQTTRGDLLIAVGGQLVTAEGHPRPLSSPVAWATSFGVAVKSKDDFHLLTGSATRNLSQCVVSLDKKKVACVSGVEIHVLSGVE